MTDHRTLTHDMLDGARTGDKQALEDLNVRLFMHGVMAFKTVCKQLVVLDFARRAGFYSRTVLMHHADVFAVVEACGSRWRVIKDRQAEPGTCFDNVEDLLAYVEANTHLDPGV